MTSWPAFWKQVLSPQTARFILALLGLASAVGVTSYIMSEGLKPAIENAVMFALGQLFALAAMAFNYYFGSTARGDEKPIETHVVNPKNDPVHVEGTEP